MSKCVFSIVIQTFETIVSVLTASSVVIPVCECLSDVCDMYVCLCVCMCVRVCVCVSGGSKQPGLCLVWADRQTAPCLQPDSKYPEREGEIKRAGMGRE